MVFSTRIMWNAIRQLFSHSLYVYLVYPMLVYGLVISLPRSRPDAQRWSILYGFVAFNIAWYAVASIGWPRYAFPALVVLALFVGRFFIDISGGMRFSAQEGLAMRNRKQPCRGRRVGQWAVLAFVVAIIAGQAVLLARQILQPPFNAPLAMADYMDANVPMDAPVKTWEPEMGFLTDHHYDFPPQLLINTAVVYVWRGGAPPASEYDFMQPSPAPYVLVGNFGSWVKLYSEDVLAARYDLVTNIGQYRLFRLK
jgi:hypothetical protein